MRMRSTVRPWISALPSWCALPSLSAWRSTAIRSGGMRNFTGELTQGVRRLHWRASAPKLKGAAHLGYRSSTPPPREVSAAGLAAGEGLPRRPPTCLACAGSVLLLSQQLGTRAPRLRGGHGRVRPRRARGPVPPGELREISRADRCPARCLTGVVGLILAFGLSLAVGRYQDRRADVVTDANTIGTAYLRAQTIAEPQRTSSLALLRATTTSRFASHTRSPAVRPSAQLPRSKGSCSAVSGVSLVRAWNARPRDSAPRLYLESLNDMIDHQTVRLSGLNNRVPDPVLWLELLGAAVAIGLLVCTSRCSGKGLIPIVVAAAIVSFLVFVTF